MLDAISHYLDSSQASGCLVITARCRRQGKWLPPPAAASAPISARTSGGRGCGRREWRTMEVPPSPPPSPSATALPLPSASFCCRHCLHLLLILPLPPSASSVCCRRLLRLLRLLLPPLCPAARSIAANMQHMTFWVVTARRRRRKKRLASPATMTKYLTKMCNYKGHEKKMGKSRSRALSRASFWTPQAAQNCIMRAAGAAKWCFA